MDDDRENIEEVVRHLLQDIGSLEQEMDILTKELEEVEKTNQKLQKLVDLEKLAIQLIKNQEKNNRKRLQAYDENEPPIVQHSYFDDSIAHYFKTLDDFGEKPMKKINLDDLAIGISQSSKKIIGLGENILYENLYRLGGVTAFPLNIPDCIGIRFDTLLSQQGKFQKPNYVVLRKQEVDTKAKGVEKKWVVFRHTLPSHVVNNIAMQFDDIGFANDEEINGFANTLNATLTRSNFIKDIIEVLQNLKYQDLISDNQYDPDAIFLEITSDQLSFISFLLRPRNTSKTFELRVTFDEMSVYSVVVNEQTVKFDQYMNERFRTVNGKLKGVKLLELAKQIKEWVREASMYRIL